MTYNEDNVPATRKRTFKQNLKTFFCRCKNRKAEPYFQSKYYPDIVHYECVDCGWIGYK